MRVRGRLIGLTCAACALLVLAAATSAGAAPARPEVRAKQLSLELNAEASNGYRLSVFTSGHHRVTLAVHRGLASARYTVRGQVSRHSIDADFGELGRISVQFTGRRTPAPSLLPPGLPPLPPAHCRGRKPVRDVGVFSGEIQFTGEQGFTQIDADRATGQVLQTYRRVCTERARAGSPAGRASASRPFPLFVRLAVQAGAAGTVKFEAQGFEYPPGFEEHKNEFGPIFFAQAREHLGRVAIERAALAFGREGSLLLSPRGAHPVTATFTPDMPFGGSGEFRQEQGSAPTWAGSLDVFLPGLGRVPLAGEGVGFEFCRGDLLRLPEYGCP